MPGMRQPKEHRGLLPYLTSLFFAAAILGQFSISFFQFQCTSMPDGPWKRLALRQCCLLQTNENVADPKWIVDIYKYYNY